MVARAGVIMLPNINTRMVRSPGVSAAINAKVPGVDYVTI